ncbi:hypothetical protein [Sporohalobacter salinus]|uniref:hypothetical protein n=1 Tax=Sporohalobacter salinus TaxID=1494606 RepID=UPI0019621DCC|nr:hypothetical protein [Sporohalobacter salinus]MBM7624704.1 putative membrane protein [Sporohalobacter salinus]
MWTYCSELYGLNDWQSWGLILFHWILLGGGIYLLVKLLSSKSNQQDDALYILKREFAEGKISKGEFKERRKFLQTE